MKGISLHSVVPVRSKANETAEMITQMLFAETCDIVSTRGNWTKVQLDLDGQEGWVDAKMVAEVEDKLLTADQIALVKMPMAYAISMNNGQTIPLTAGTRLPNYQDGQFSLLGVNFRIDPNMVAQQPLELNQHTLLEVVRFYLNIPYLWGGKNAMGMDCSGFTQTIMSLFGRKLLRNASEQAEQGKVIKSLKQVQAGDLLFFDHADQDPQKTNISHVGIAIDSERIIHCSGRVKVEKLDKNGIYSAEFGKYTHHLASIRRI